MANAKRVTRKKSPKTTRRAMTKIMPECAVECTEEDMYVVFDGVRIAKRGKPNTPQAKAWISLQPGFAVYNTADLSEIIIELNGTRLQ
jgi:hypothetical protein